MRSLKDYITYCEWRERGETASGAALQQSGEVTIALGAACSEGMAAVSPAEAHAEIEGVIIGAAADAAVVTQVDLSRRGDGSAGQQADDGAVARRRGAEHGEAIAGRTGERRRNRPAGVGELVLPAEPDRDIELALAAKADGTSEIGADGCALRVGGLLRHVEVERLRARLREGVLGHARNLKAPERRDAR